MSEGLCSDCVKKPHCQTLCPEAEAYANEEWHGSAFDETTERPEIIEYQPKSLPLSPTQIEIARLFSEGHTRPQVCGILGISAHNLREQVRQMKGKMKNGRQ